MNNILIIKRLNIHEYIFIFLFKNFDVYIVYIYINITLMLSNFFKYNSNIK